MNFYFIIAYTYLVHISGAKPFLDVAIFGNKWPISYVSSIPIRFVYHIISIFSAVFNQSPKIRSSQCPIGERLEKNPYNQCDDRCEKLQNCPIIKPATPNGDCVCDNNFVRIPEYENRCYSSDTCAIIQQMKTLKRIISPKQKP